MALSTVLESTRSHLAAMIAEGEAARTAVAMMVEKHKNMLSTLEVEVATEAARIPTMSDLKDLMARMA